MKPSLFNTEMVRAILENRKTVTRRVVQMPDTITAETVDRVRMKNGLAHFSWSLGEAFAGFDVKPPYSPDDILYVRETFDVLPAIEEGSVLVGSRIFYYKADGDLRPDGWKGRWRPSIHMPREAARIFLRVTDVRVERLQDIGTYGVYQEGLPECGIDPCCVGICDKCLQDQSPIRKFVRLWDSTIKPKDRVIYGWDANPWVWVIEFERCEKPVGE